MRQQPTNICPLNGYPCVGSRCAWWDFGGNECALVTAAFAIREVAENLETLASKSQTFGILQNNGLPDAANTEQADGGKQTLTDAVSASTITENGGFVK